MTWFAFQGYNNGKAVDIAGSQEKEAVTLGFHGYGTEAQAEKQPNSVNVLTSWFVNAIIADYGYAVKAGEQPGGPHATLTPGNVIAGTAQAAASSLWGSFPWLRIGEVVLGLVLIAVGVAKLTNAVPIATTVAKAVS